MRHLPIGEREVTLYLQTNRYRCQPCAGHTTTTERGDWYDTEAGCTLAFAKFLLRELFNSTLQDVAANYGVKYFSEDGLVLHFVLGEGGGGREQRAGRAAQAGEEGQVVGRTATR